MGQLRHYGNQGKAIPKTEKNWQHCQEFKNYKFYKDSLNFFNFILHYITKYVIVILKKGENNMTTIKTSTEMSNHSHVYEGPNNFMIDIVCKDDSYEAWIYKKDMGVKELMFGIPKENNHLWTMEELVVKNLEEYMKDYEITYCQE